MVTDDKDKLLEVTIFHDNNNNKVTILININEPLIPIYITSISSGFTLRNP